MNLPIFSHIYSVTDKTYILERLAILEAGTFSTKKSYEEQVHEQFSLFLAESLLQTSKDLKVSTESPASIQKFLRDLQERLKKLPQVSIRLAITPNDDTLRSISKWFDATLGEKTLVSFVVDPALLGGVVIEWNGIYLDYSLKKRLAQVLQAQPIGQTIMSTH
jgi:flagellar biosynthesis/type III secretory pathway protein FliH